MKERYAHNYFSLFDGAIVPLSKIREENPMMGVAVESLIESGKAIGQKVFDENMTIDTLVYIPRRDGEHGKQRESPLRSFVENESF